MGNNITVKDSKGRTVVYKNVNDETYNEWKSTQDGAYGTVKNLANIYVNTPMHVKSSGGATKSSGNDSRFDAVEDARDKAMSGVEEAYGDMINNSDSFYQAQINASKQWGDKQAQIQQEKTDFAIEQINQQKAQAKQDYTREQSGAYVDWQKQSNQYGANAEQMAEYGMGGTGYSESSQVSMYNQYQSRIATARESYNRAVLNYDNAIKDAQIQNNAALAEIAYQALQTQLELSLEGFQYKNQLIQEKLKVGLEVDETYYNRYQDVLDQINTENALAEEIRQYNEKMAEEKRQHNESLAEEKRQYDQSLALQKAQLAEQQRQFNVQQAAKKASSSGGSSGGSSRRSSGGSVKKSSSSGSSSSVKKSGSSTKKNTTKQNTSAYAYLNALIASGASKDKVSNEIAIALREGAISKAEAQKLRSVFTPRGLAY